MAANSARQGSTSALPGQYQLGEYIIKSVLGEGGFGVTYLAQDSKLDSLVAIKEYFPRSLARREKGFTIVPKPHDPNAQQFYEWGLKEFLKEARVLARFKHNYIVRVLRFLEANGTAYMVMEYEEGQALQDVLKRRGGFLDEKALLAIFLPILSGLQAVHDAGLLHLDIKPDNIYIRRNGQPMLIDFGSASQIAQGGEENKVIALTPAYSAIENYPDIGEQGPWSDVYSLGATIYRCITGKQPVNTIDRYKALKGGLADPLVPATKFERPIYSPSIRECVDWAMSLKAEDRPKSAAVLQSGLMGKGRAAKDQQEEKHKVNIRSGYIGVAKVREEDPNRKKKRKAWEGLLVLLVFIFAAVILTPKILISTNVMSEEELWGMVADLGVEFDKLKQDFEVTVMRKKVVQEDVVAEQKRRLKLLEEQKNDVPVKSFDPEKTLRHTLIGHLDSVESIAFLNNDSLLASISSDGEIRLWNIETGRSLGKLRGKSEVSGVIASSIDRKLLAVPGMGNVINLWNSETKKQQGSLSGHGGLIYDMAFAPNGKWLATVSEDQQVIIWDLGTFQPIHTIVARDKQQLLAAAFNPTSSLLAIADDSGKIQYVSTDTGKIVSGFPAHKGKKQITTLDYTPNGKWLVTGGENGFVKIWNVGLKEPDRLITGIPGDVQLVRFSPDGKWLLILSSEGPLRLWDMEAADFGGNLDLKHVHSYGLAMSLDGAVIATSGKDRRVRIWGVAESKPDKARVKAAPLKTVPVKRSPVKAAPVKTVPVKRVPAKAAPHVASRKAPAPIKSDPVKKAPVKAAAPAVPKKVPATSAAKTSKPITKENSTAEKDSVTSVPGIDSVKK